MFPFKKVPKLIESELERGWERRAQLSIPAVGKPKLKIDAHLWKGSSMVGMVNTAHVGNSGGYTTRRFPDRFRLPDSTDDMDPQLIDDMDTSGDASEIYNPNPPDDYRRVMDEQDMIPLSMVESEMDVDGMSVLIPTDYIKVLFRLLDAAHTGVRFKTGLSKEVLGTNIATEGYARLFLPPMDVSWTTIARFGPKAALFGQK